MNFRFISAIGISFVIHLMILWVTFYITGMQSHHTNINNIILQVKLASPTKAIALNVARTQSSDSKIIKPTIGEKKSKLEPDIKQQAGYIKEIKYYKLSELDQKPAITQGIDTNPIELRQYAQGGELTIQLWISEFGAVENAEILKSDLPQEFNNYALTSFKSSKFLPGIKDGVPVKSIAKLTMQFRSTN